MTKMSPLSQDLMDKILSKAPITSLGAVRSTRKGWNASSKERLLCKGEPKQEFPGFIVMNHRLCSMRFNLHGILNEDGEDFVNPSIKEIGNNLLNHQAVEISKLFHCDGLVLCATRDNTCLVVWNPYLGQTRRIDPKTSYEKTDKYAMGYDKNNNHKILRFYDEYEYYEIYDFDTNSWREGDVIPGWDIDCSHRAVSLKGNIYLLSRETQVEEDEDREDEDRVDHLISFDFTSEEFVYLPMPFQYHVDYIGTLSRVKEDKLAALYQRWDTREMEVWITTKIEANEVSWSNLFRVDMEPLIRFGFRCEDEAGSFFIDEEKKVAVVFNLDEVSDKKTKKKRFYHTAHIVGEKGYFKKVVLGEAVEDCAPPVCSSSYAPSLVQINQFGGRQWEEKKTKSKMIMKRKRSERD